MKNKPFALILGLALSACAPALDWREVRPAGADLLALFPCKPEVESRQQPAAMGLAVCQAAGASFSVSWTEVAEPAQVGPALAQMREALATKLQARARPGEALQVPGMTPQLQAQQQALEGGTQPARVAVFARGLRVYQATLLGATADPAAWETFVTGLRLAS
ncbi:hypothetical protein G8A07_24720 [Roseateles sp. DAIF2]|uniref:hypothetical protein n=1 Tax=Roseateles sp. DAIF2 TaxID=2714952 RepID=UPI0018A2D52A|nr:hypothetical protein [Roseateles sp. DAIF2]QPF75795.1 hypothetical protein G8A07_24720 [Roseateles sp. DAIF2]